MPFIVLVGFVALNCGRSSVAPAGSPPVACTLDSRFPGVWESARRSQVGPATMRFSFGCECDYSSRVRVLLMGIREKGWYAVQDGKVLLTRASGQVTGWPFRFEGKKLILEEYPNEWHAYERSRELKCDRDAAAGERAEGIPPSDRLP